MELINPETKTFSPVAIRLLVFDFDGVLVDTQAVMNEIKYQYLKKIGCYDASEKEFVERFSGMRIRTVLEILGQEKNIPLYETFQHIGENIDNLILDRFANQKIPPLAGVVDFLSSSSLERCIGSNCSLKLLRLFLEASNLARFFGDNVFSADMVEHPKPAADVYLYSARQMGMKPEECLVIEDSVAGVQAAVAAGMQAVGFLGGSHVTPAAAQNLLAAGAKNILHDMRHLVI